MDDNMRNNMGSMMDDDEGATTVLTSGAPVGPMDDDEGATTVLVGGPQGMPAPQFGGPQGAPAPQFGGPQGAPVPQFGGPQGMPAPGMMAPQGMPNPGMAPQGMPNPGMMAPQGMPNPGMMAPQGMSNPPKQKKQKAPKQGGKKNVGLIVGIVVAVLVALAVGAYFLFFTPAKRLERKLSAAQTAMDSQKYEDARTNYKAALKIDDENVEAMLGMVQAEKELGELDQAKTDADSYREVIKGLAEDKLQSEVENVVAFYQAVGDLYSDNVDKKIEIYKEGYELVDDTVLMGALVDAYLAKADVCDMTEDYEEMFDLYDKVLALQPSNQKAKASKADTAEAVLENMMDAELYDDAEAFIEKYSDIDGVDFDSYTNRIEEQREIITKRHDLMEQVISLMSAGDFEAMLDVDGSENASFVISTLEGDRYVYAKDGFTDDYTGMAAGIYEFTDEWMGSAYCFYYGEYKNGVRDGQGTYFIKLDGYNDSYEVYEGAWSNDKPNGQGVMTRVNEDAGSELVTRTWTGNFTNGLADGSIDMTLTDEDGYVYTTTISASNGSTSDVRDQYPDYDFSDVDSDTVVYAVLDCDDTNEYWWFSHNGNGLTGLYVYVLEN